MAHQRQDSTGSAYDPSAATHYQHQMQLQHQHQQQQQHPQYPMMNQQQHDPSVPSSNQPPMQHAHMQLLHSFWMNQMHDIENVQQDFKIHHLPLARIKKVMKTDEDVKAKMISAEAPMIFDKGCEIFITELTIRAWIHAEENKRRTLQRSDIAAAISKTDMFDFLIDIVPREEFKAAKEAKEAASGHGKPASGGGIEHRRSQESFPTMGGAGPDGPTAAGSSGGPIGLEGYGYPYKIGVGLTAFGLFFMLMGVMMFFDGGLLAIGNILFLAGLTMVIGPQKTMFFFARPQKIRGTICFFMGILLIFIKWPIIGILVELFGFINLFGDFFPVIIGFLRRLPVIGNILSAPGISKVVDRISGQRLPV
ncbi:Golgi Transport [Haplosporangium gracile]|nr:Golgi Transport [Haplosporangium gracile]